MVNRPPDPQPAPFLSQFPRETYQFYFRQHWIRLLPPFLRTCGFNVLIILITWGLSITGTLQDVTVRHTVLLLLAFFFCLVQWEFLVKFYHYFLYVVIITDKRVHRVKRTLLATDDQQSIDLWSLQDIYKSQHGLIQNIFGYGTLVLEAQESVLRIHFIPGIRKRYDAIIAILGKGQSAWQQRSGFSLSNESHAGMEPVQSPPTITDL